jgi:hypothetical protein
MEMNGRAQSPIGMAIGMTVGAASAAGKFKAEVIAEGTSPSWGSKRIVNFSPWRYTRACDGVAA